MSTATIMKFKVLDGKHQVYERNNPDNARDIKVISYPRNSIVESTVDLAKRFNRPGCRKFERVADTVPTVQAKQRTIQEEMEERTIDPVDPYAGLTKAELIDVANRANIDLPKGANKLQILDILREETVGDSAQVE